jgi:toxin ParE1/3/4
MTPIELAPEVAQDLERILDHLIQHESEGAADRIAEIVDAIDVLASNPRIGRPLAAGSPRVHGLRELVIGRRSRGFIALYRHVQEIDTVVVLAVRSQREAGYRRE